MGCSSQSGRVEGTVPSTLSTVSASSTGVAKLMSTIITVPSIAPRKHQIFWRINSSMQATGFFRLSCIGEGPPL